MGNCINHSSSTAVASQEGVAVVETKPAEVEESVASCDERTVGSSSYAPTASPPGSPMLPSVIATGRPRPSQNNDSKPVASTNNISSTTLGSEDEDSSVMEQQREEGQKRLRELVITGANAGTIDWKSIIALAEDLHRKEQEFLRSYNEHKRAGANGRNSCNSTRTNISRRQAFFEKRRRRKDIARRKKLESVGSFSVNVLSYDEGKCEQQKPCVESSGVGSAVDAPIVENDVSRNSIEVDELEMEDEIDVFEDDDPSPLYHAVSRYKRPATPAPFIRPTSVAVSFGGSFSFMAATSLFNSAEGEEEEEESSSCSSDSSTSSSVQNGDHWDLVTIDENSTVADW